MQLLNNGALLGANSHLQNSKIRKTVFLNQVAATIDFPVYSAVVIYEEFWLAV